MPSPECLLTFLKQTELGGLAFEHAGVEQISVPRDAEDSFDACPGVHLIVIQRRRLELPAQPVIQSQVGTSLPRILSVDRILVLVIVLTERNELECTSSSR